MYVVSKALIVLEQVEISTIFTGVYNRTKQKVFISLQF